MSEVKMHPLCALRPRQVQPVPLGELVGEAGREFFGARAAEVLVRGVSMDSQDLAAGEAFIALSGANTHAARFAAQAQQAGAVAVITDDEGLQIIRECAVEIPVAVVKDPRALAGVIAARAYAHPAQHLRMLGVTGTNGKTTTCFTLHSILEAAGLKSALTSTAQVKVGRYEALSSRTSLEAPVLQRLLALAVEEGCAAAVVEVSSHAVSLHRIGGIVFDVVGFTNLQHDHLDFYGTLESYFAAKAQLLTSEHARAAVICVDDEWGRRAAESCDIPHLTFTAYGRGGDDTDFAVEDEKLHVQTVSHEFTLRQVAESGEKWPRAGAASVEGAVRLRMGIPGVVNLQNAALAYLMAVRVLGVDAQAASEGLLAVRVPGRFEVVSRRSDTSPLVIVDYAHTPEALRDLLKLVRNFTCGQLRLLFGTDGDRDASKRAPLARTAARLADELWVTDENPRTENPARIREELLRAICAERAGDLSAVHHVQTSRRDAVREAIFAADPQDTVLCTGKGNEHYQEVMGVAHAYSELEVCREVLRVYPRRAQFKAHDLPLEV